MPSVAVVIPYAEGCPHRARALTWVLERWRTAHPDWPVTVSAAGRDPWVKALAVTPALADLDTDIVIVADADVWTVPGRAVEAVAAGAPWAIPHTLVWRLTELSTAALLAGADLPLETLERPYTGIRGGGIVVAPRATLVEIPLDPRFEGWGQEDASWGLALQTLAGKPWRGADPLRHLYHPPQPRMNRKTGNVAGQRLHRRYLAARANRAAMRALIEEVTPCRSTSC